MEELKLPERFEEYSEGRKAGFLKMKAAKESGRKVAGYFCTYTPLEVLDAAGMLSVSLCGMSNETIPAAETVLPKNLCPLIKSSYGFAITDKCPYTYWSDLIVGETTCDGKKKMYDLLGQRLAILAEEKQAPGEYNYRFGAREMGFGSGVYLMKLTVNDESQTFRLIEVE